MASSCASSRTLRKQPRARILLLAVLSITPAFSLAASSSADTASIQSHLSRTRQVINQADVLHLTPRQLGGLWSQVASDYQDLSEPTESEAAYNHALGLLERDPADQAAYAVTLGNLASLYATTGRFDAEENCYKRSLSILEKLGDPLPIAKAQAHLADGYLAMGKNKQAARFSSLAMQSLTRTPSATAEDKGSVLVTYAYASCLTGHCSDGLTAARQALALAESAFDARSFQVGQAHIALGFMEGKTGASSVAEQDLREGIRILELALPPSHPLVSNALLVYHDFLAANHRDADAARVAEQQRHARSGAECTTCVVSAYALRQP